MYRLSVIFAYIAFINVINAFPANKTRQVVSFSKEANEHLQLVIKNCVANESDVPVLLKVVREGKYREDDEFKNFIHCAYKKSGYAFENGRVNIEMSAPLYPDPVAMLEVMKECDKERGTTAVDNTFQFFKCFQERSPFLIGL